MGAHRVSSNTHYHPERKEKASGPRRTGEPSKEEKRSQNDKSQGRNNMNQRESCMRRKCGIERGQHRWSGLRGVSKSNRAPKYHGHGNYNAGPKPDTDPDRRTINFPTILRPF